MPYTPRPEGYREILAERQTAIWGDLYTWAMAQALYKLKKMGAPVNYDTPVVFDGFVRKEPFGGAYTAVGGTEITAEWLDKNWQPTSDIIDYLKTVTVKDLRTGGETRLFEDDFLEDMANEKMAMTVDMIPEGGLVFRDEPFANVTGSMGQAVRAEVGFLNAFNSQALFATKATRLKTAANGKPVFELGVRRAHSIGGEAESRAGYIGGLDGTSNMQAGFYYRVPIFGSVAHAWIMLHETEGQAFVNLARAMPHNFSALVDTFDTLQGTVNALSANSQVAGEMNQNHLLKAVRLDSGKLIYLSNEVDKILKTQGVRDKVKIVVTSDLDEKSIMDLEREGSADVYGVGTKFVTCPMQPALGAVYKLAAAERMDMTAQMMERYRQAQDSGDNSPEALAEFMRDVIKLGEKPQPGEFEKATIPGAKVILRTMFKEASGAWRYDGDIIFPAGQLLPVKYVQNPDGPYEAVLTAPVTSVPKNDPDGAKTFLAGTPVVLPLKRVFTNGVLTGDIGTVHNARVRMSENMALLAPDHKSLTEPYPYGVGIEEGLYKRRQAMIAEIRGRKLSV